MRRSVLVRASLRHLSRHPWQLVLAVLGVALGVAVVVAIDLANGSARRAFEMSAEAVAGRATHEIVGGPTGIPDSVYVRLRVKYAVRPSAPVVEGELTVSRRGDRPARALRLLGVDPLVEDTFRPALGRQPGIGATSGSAAFFVVPGAVLVTRETGRLLGVEPGDSLAVLAGAEPATLRIAGWIAPRSELDRVGLRDVAVADVSTAQEVLGRVGSLDRIDLIAPAGPRGDSLLARVEGALPPGLEVRPAGSRTDTVRQMTRAFSLNLTALGLLALLFGGFLIYDSTSFSVVQRRELIGVLRALGVTRREVFALVLAEGVAIGAAGSALGLVAGIGLAGGLLRLVTRTINDLYFAVSVSGVHVSALALGGAFALGVATTAAATLPAAIEATLAPPRAAWTRSVLEERFRRLAPRLAAAGAAVAGLGVVVLALPTPAVLPAFAGLFAVVVGSALTFPLLLVGLMAALRPVMRGVAGLLGGMAARSVSASLSRTAPAVTSLAVAVSVTVALGIMIGSFRDTVRRWLATTLRADVYVSAPGGVSSHAQGTLAADVVRRVVGAQGVRNASINRSVRIPDPRGPVRLMAIGTAGREEAAFDLKRGDPAEVWPAWHRGAVIVSEPFAFRRDLQVGDTLRLRTDHGMRAFPVAGIYYDYGSDQGAVVMALETYRREWDDPGVTALGLYAADGVAAEDLVDAVRRSVPGEALVIRSNRSLREASLQVFDRTFAITAVLRLLAFVVAFIGVLSALMALQLERSREMGVLRATGVTRGEVWRLVSLQTGLMGLASGLLSIPLGVGMALVMVFVINRRSFGWTLHFRVSGEVLLEAVLLAVAASLLAGVYPAWRMARTKPAAALREE